MLQSSIRPTGTSASRACPSARPGEAGRWPRWTGSRWIAWSAARDRTCRYCCSQLWAQSHAAYPFRSLPQMCAAWADKLEQEYAAATAAGRIDPGEARSGSRCSGPCPRRQRAGAASRQRPQEARPPDRHARARFLAELAGIVCGDVHRRQRPEPGVLCDRQGARVFEPGSAATGAVGRYRHRLFGSAHDCLHDGARAWPTPQRGDDRQHRRGWHRGDRPAVVRRHLGQWTADMAKPVRADLPPACLVMVVETLLGFNKYSGRARHHRSAARSAPASAAGPA